MTLNLIVSTLSGAVKLKLVVLLPLVLATDAGAEMRHAMGNAVFSGMIGVTVFGLLFTPVFYMLVTRKSTKIQELSDD